MNIFRNRIGISSLPRQGLMNDDATFTRFLSRYFSQSKSTTTPKASAPRIFFLTSNNEDYQVENEVVRFIHRQRGRPKKGLDVLQVAGGGDTTLSSLMLPEVDNVQAIDMNRRQLNLLKLKLAVAVSPLSSIDAAYFLGALKDNRRDDTRIEVVEKVLGKFLKDDGLVNFCLGEAREIICEGIVSKGGNLEGLYSRLRDVYLKEYGLDVKQLYLDSSSSTSKTQNDQRVKLSEHACKLMEDGKIFTTEILHEEMKFDTLPKEMQEIIGQALPTFQKVHNNGFTALMRDLLIPKHHNNELKRSFYSELQFLGYWSKDLYYPPWLQEKNRYILRKASSKSLGFIEGRIDALHTSDEANKMKRFDFISTSNIFDWTSIDGSIEQIKNIVKSSIKTEADGGGYILIRRAMGNSSTILKGAGGIIDSSLDEQVNQKLFKIDRNPFFYGNLDSIAVAKFVAPG